jgi:hypothetical protein
MRNRNRSHLGNLAEQLNDATEQLVKVVHRLDEFEAQVDDKQYLSTIDPDDFAKCPDAEDKPQHKLFNPEAGP